MRWLHPGLCGGGLVGCEAGAGTGFELGAPARRVVGQHVGVDGVFAALQGPGGFPLRALAQAVFG
ncbi:MAG: hypothetical protein ACOVN2_08990, partial [Usitatibacteraceae bacterium]